MRTPSEAAEAWAAMSAQKALNYGWSRPRTVRDEYEALRDNYVTGSIDLEQFAAEVVKLLLRGL